MKARTSRPAAGRWSFRSQLAAAGAVAVVLVALAGLAALVTALIPALGASIFPVPPHPTFHGRPAEALDVWLTNLAVLSVPILFTGAAGGRPGPWRTAGDLVLVVVASLNALVVGVALGHFGGRLLPYLPHLPIEAAALAVSASTWISGRSQRVGLIRPFLAVAGLAALGAAVEVFATPRVS